MSIKQGWPVHVVIWSDDNSGALPLVTGDTWPGEPEEQGNAVVLTLMTDVALGMGLLVLELIMVPGWGPGVWKGWCFRGINPADGCYQTLGWNGMDKTFDVMCFSYFVTAFVGFPSILFCFASGIIPACHSYIISLFHPNIILSCHVPCIL